MAKGGRVTGVQLGDEIYKGIRVERYKLERKQTLKQHALSSPICKLYTLWLYLVCVCLCVLKPWYQAYTVTVLACVVPQHTDSNWQHAYYLNNVEKMPLTYRYIGTDTHRFTHTYDLDRDGEVTTARLMWKHELHRCKNPYLSWKPRECVLYGVQFVCGRVMLSSASAWNQSCGHTCFTLPEGVSVSKPGEKERLWGTIPLIRL